MRAIQVKTFGAPSVMELVELPEPAPASGEVRVRIHAAGVNPVDAYIRSGNYALKPDLPYTPGGDGAGTIEAIGSDVVGLTLGQRVYVGGTIAGNIFGTYATHALCRADQVHPLADHLSFEQGAAVNVAYVTGYRALVDRAGARPGESVLVHGASGGGGG
ncbi:MAG TPA: alcohol dehydrogenase catalytic domain-containing protein, partial [Tepidisphaeraceae bacterium]|nr:alcohol dehydrogenase catalytic domain-containing protein [Tepidisphaeraceae bacterium]